MKELKRTRRAVFASYGIQYKEGRILAPGVGWVYPLLKRGNRKTGKNVYTWSTLPGTADYTLEIDGKSVVVCGTCACTCRGCYALRGTYGAPSVRRSLAVHTYLAEKHLDFIYRAISAQIEIIGGNAEIRIHAAGDFNTTNSEAYARTWYNIARNFPSCRFWTYTKCKRFENLFDGLNNANIVKSIIPSVGINFGKCGYIINAYYTLKAIGQPVYICKCGFDPGLYCDACGICASCKYVLFVEHSTGYDATKDPLYSKLLAIVNNQ